MRVLIAVGLMVLLILVTYFQQPNSLTPQELLKNMSTTVEQQTLNITNQEGIRYVSLYNDSNINARSVVGNIANAIVYPILVVSNTAIPLTVYIAKGQYGQLLAKLSIPIIIIIIILTVFIIFWVALPPIITIYSWYYFFKEKRKMRKEYKEKWLD